jgi:hypothetical protein
MFDEMAHDIANLGNLKSAKRNSDSKIHVFFRSRDPSLFPFRFISPWSTTALSSFHEHLSPAAPFKLSSVTIFINKLFSKHAVK